VRSPRSWRTCGGIFDAPAKIERIAALEAAIAAADFWSDQERAQTVIRELKELKNLVDPLLKVEKGFQELAELVGIVDDHDARSIEHLRAEAARWTKTLDELEFKRLMGGRMDPRDAIMSINAGAGGTEACDWAGMLLRMYAKWAEGRGHTIEWLDTLQGEEAGIKNVTVLIRGSYAYGSLKGETGVHRLVRISPFDSNQRRHTSFASVDVIPDVADDIAIEVKEAELKIDTYRAGGKGGQHVNKTESAVRITHVPSGIIVQCQNERSQFKNKAMALKILKAKLFEREERARAAETRTAYDAKKEISWGSQIRSYVLHPYSLVKDHRTDYETSNAQAVLDGDLDKFTQAYLSWRAGG
jgi:peptide chain release factor 2